jgi:hypothetical protein
MSSAWASVREDEAAILAPIVGGRESAQHKPEKAMKNG